MYINRINKQTNQPSMLWLILALAALILCMSAMVGCSAAKKAARAEKKALNPYKAVNSDVDTAFKAKKKELIARVCAVNFPIEIKKIKYDSVIYKNVRVVDNTKINQLKKEVERLKNSIPNVNTDSLYQSFYDSVLNDLPECKQVEHYQKSDETKKDTISLNNMAKDNSELHSKVNVLNAENTSLNKHIEDIAKDLNDAKKDKNKWKLYFFLLLGAGIVYKVAKIYLSKSFTLPKIL